MRDRVTEVNLVVELGHFTCMLLFSSQTILPFNTKLITYHI